MGFPKAGVSQAEEHPSEGRSRTLYYNLNFPSGEHFLFFIQWSVSYEGLFDLGNSIDSLA